MEIIVNNFDLSSTLLSGQCFRVYEEDDGSFTCILNDRVINVKQEGDILKVSSSNENNLKDIIINYFDLDRDYESLNNEICKDSIMKECVSKCKGYKLLKQDGFEMCISYIISQNNNVKRISKSIELLCKNRGTEIVFNNNNYYLFPSYEQIKDITLDELRSYGVGFRDKYIKCFLDNYNTMRDISLLNTNDALDELMKVKGIGMKVASCILLFGYSRFDVFPIDTWVKHFIAEKYNIKDNQKIISKFASEKFGKYSGLAIQYMFHSQRNV